MGNLRAQQWYNGDSPRNLSEFIDDKSNRLIGWPVMRQLRIKSDVCPVPSLRSRCTQDYSLFNEEKGSFSPGWMNASAEEHSSSIRRAFKYKSSDELDSYVCVGDHGKYSGGGYVYEFRGRLADLQSNLSELHRLGWVDGQTRAIIIQLSLYNPNVQLFTSVTFLIESLSTGGLSAQSRFEPLNFYGKIVLHPARKVSSVFLAFVSQSQLICTIIYMIFIIHSMFAEIRLFFRLKRTYFRRFWSMIELGIIVCSWMGVGISIWRYRECSRIGQLFKETNGYVYISLQFFTYINDLLIFIYGFCCFFGTIKLIRLCRFNARIYLFIQTLQRASKELLSFAMMFSIVFFSFLCLFYFLFQSNLWSYSSLLQTAETLFEMILMNFDAQQLTEAAAFLGPCCFALFIIIVVFVCLSMFLTIINESFCQARENVKEDSRRQIYSFLFDRFLRWTGKKKLDSNNDCDRVVLVGVKKPSVEELHEERDAMMRSKYFDPIERFPERIDQLLDAINRVGFILPTSCFIRCSL